MTIYAIDPGPHTGIVFWNLNLRALERKTLDLSLTRKDGKVVLREDAHEELYEWLEGWINPNTDQIVLESFEYRKEDAQEREYIDYSTGELVGVVKVYAQLCGVKYFMQSASQAKQFWTDDKLRRVGLWVPGKEQRHVRDATRHWLYYLTFTKKNQTWINKLKQ